jgi:hypothetical protein
MATVGLMKVWTAAAVVGIAGLLGGCGAEPQRCVGDCPDLSGEYAVTENFAATACGYVTYELGPALILEQATLDGRLRTQLIDPLRGLEVPFVGEVYAENGDGRVGSFLFLSRVTRPISGTDPNLATLEVRMTGTVYEEQGRRIVSGQLVTTQVRGPEVGCATMSNFLGQDRRPVPEPPAS